MKAGRKEPKYFPQGSAVRTGNSYGKVIDPTPDYWKLAAAFDGYGERARWRAEPALHFRPCRNA